MPFCGMHSNVTQRVENEVKSYTKSQQLLVQHLYYRGERSEGGRGICDQMPMEALPDLLGHGTTSWDWRMWNRSVRRPNLEA